MYSYKRIAIIALMSLLISASAASAASACHIAPPPPKHHDHGGWGKKDHHNGGGQTSSGGFAASAPAETEEVGGIALCAPVPMLRSDGSIGVFFQVDGSVVSDLEAQGFSPALYIQGAGTSCSLSDAHVNPSDYTLVPNVLATDGGMIFPTAVAAAEGGASAIHPYYARV